MQENKRAYEGDKMTDITESQKYFEQEAEAMQDSMADKKEKIAFFKSINFQNVLKARRLLNKLKEEYVQLEDLIFELQERIQVYEDITEEDTRLAME